MIKKDILRLLFIAPTNELKAGGEKSHFELIIDARKRGYNVHVILPDHGEFSETLSTHNIGYSIVPYRWWRMDDNPNYSLFSIIPINDIIKKEHIDVVITNTLNIPWGAFSAAIENKPHIWIAREFPFDEFSYLNAKYKFIHGSSNLVMANSEELADYMSLDRDARNVKYFYSYVDVSNIKLDKKNDNPPNIVSIGTIQPRKNQLELLKAIKQLKDENILNKVLIIGAGDEEYTKLLKDYIIKNNLANVELVGHQNDPWSFVKEGDIFVQSSSSESIGRTTTEAMKLGVINIGSDIRGVLEAHRLGGGVTYSLGDPNDLSIKLKRIIKNHTQYVNQAQEIKDKVLDSMSLSSCHNNFFDQLDSIKSLDNPMKGLDILKIHLASVKTSQEGMLERIQSLEHSLNDLVKENIQMDKELSAARNTITRRIVRKVNRLTKSLRNT